MKSKHRACPICKSNDIKSVAELEIADFDNVTLDRMVMVVVCDKCGMVFNDTSTDSTGLDLFYQNETLYDSEVGAGTGGTTQWDLNRYEGYVNFLSPLINLKESIIVDVGCAKGGFLAFMKGKGFDRLRGVEVNARCAEFARNAYGITVDVGSAHKLPTYDEKVDLISYNHVFEHIYDLYLVINEASKILKDDGFLFIDVPDATRYSECTFSNFYLLSFREHINHFDSVHLKILLDMAGFDLVSEKQRFEAYNNDNFILPTLNMLFRRRAGNTRGEASFDDGLLNILNRYVEVESQGLTVLQNKVNNLIDSGLPVYPWGIGNEFFCLYNMAGLNKCKILFLVDKNPRKQERTVDGLKIFGPESLKDAPHDSTVVIASALYKEDMKNYLREIGYCGEVLVLA